MSYFSRRLVYLTSLQRKRRRRRSYLTRCHSLLWLSNASILTHAPPRAIMGHRDHAGQVEPVKKGGE